MFSIRFSAAEFYPTIRRKHFTQIEIFSFVGGLLGLFLGFSVLSFAEIIYFIAFGLMGKVKKRRVSPVVGITLAPRTNGAVTLIQGFCLNYMKTSSIHSFIYIADVTRSKVERIIWLISFILSMTGCVFMISNLYKKLNINLISIAFEDAPSNASQVPFPAVTIFGDYPIPQFADTTLDVDFIESYDEINPMSYGSVKAKSGFLLKYCLIFINISN